MATRAREMLRFLLALGAAAAFTSPRTAMPAARATRVVRVAPTASVPSVAAVAAACTLPTCLGFWKTGYAVSYGYGGAMLASAALAYPATGGLARAHALALAFYGARLNCHLLYRELCLPEAINQMKKRPASLTERLKRAPLVMSCAFLYWCMVAPQPCGVECTNPRGPRGGQRSSPLGGVLSLLSYEALSLSLSYVWFFSYTRKLCCLAHTTINRRLRVTHASGLAFGGPAGAAVAVAFAGFGLAALGDTWKSIVKARDGANALVVGGPFRYLRHPNYTGELIGWTASFVAALVAAASTPGGLVKHSAWLAISALGTTGIYFVLAGEAAPGLEKKQRAKYGGRDDYERWVAKTWAGPQLNTPAPSKPPIVYYKFERVAWSGTCYPSKN